MPGIFGSLGGFLGSFSQKIFASIASIGGDITDVLGLGREAGANPILDVIDREWIESQRSRALEPSFTTLRQHEFVPHDWYTESDIPWNRPIAYKVNMYGRDLATGRYTSQDFDVTVSREMTIGDVIEESRARLGATGESPAIDIYNVKVIGASKRAGDELW